MPSRRLAPRRLLTIAVAAMVAMVMVTTATGAATPDLDGYGGFTAIDGSRTGRFHVERIEGVWWFVDPDGHAFFSSGVNSVNPAADFAPALGASPYLDHVLEQYGSPRAWARATVKRLRGWGFNTAGAFSLPSLLRDRIPYTALLTFSQYAPTAPKEAAFAGDRPVPDYLGPWFEVAADAYAQDAAAGCARDPYCIGVFTDNEPAWGRAVNQSASFLQAYLQYPAGASAKVAVQRFLERRYRDDVAAFNGVWGTQLPSFDGLQQLTQLPVAPTAYTAQQLLDDHAVRDFVAEQYFEVVQRALRKVSKDLLNLGPRFDALNTPADIYKVAAPFVDVISINDYEWNPSTLASVNTTYASEGYLFRADPWQDLDTVAKETRRPILISEFGYRAVVPDGPQGLNPPTMPRLPDQAARAASYRKFMQELYDRSAVIGAHWFQLMDQPASGRGDGQDSNWGLVDIDNRPWRPLVEAARAENRALPSARLR